MHWCYWTQIVWPWEPELGVKDIFAGIPTLLTLFVSENTYIESCLPMHQYQHFTYKTVKLNNGPFLLDYTLFLLPTMCSYTCGLLIKFRWAFINCKYRCCVCACVCICVNMSVSVVGVPIVSGESGYRGSLNVLTSQPINTVNRPVIDGSALRVSDHQFLLPTTHHSLNFIKPELICSLGKR